MPQSANQLKTPAKVSQAFKMVSQFGSPGYTIMGKTADLTVVQKTIIDTLTDTKCCIQACWKKKVWKKKMHNQPREPQPYEDCQAKLIQEFGWTSQGMDWGWVKASRATTHRRVKEFGYSCRQRRLTWAKEKKNWTVAQWSKVLFSDESKFYISFGNQGPRVWRKGGEAHSPSFLKSSVKFPQSEMIWGAMSFAGVGPLCGSIVSLHPFNFGALPSADQLFKDADFIFQQDLVNAHTAKSTKSWLNDHGVGVLDWPANSSDLNPIENQWGIVKRKIRNKRQKKMQMSWRPLSKKPGLPYHLSRATNWSPPCHAELRQ